LIFELSFSLPAEIIHFQLWIADLGIRPFGAMQNNSLSWKIEEHHPNHFNVQKNNNNNEFWTYK
jgi:hypothetical protein